MDWTYTGNDRLARAATRLYELRPHPCRISPLVFMTDPDRVPDILAIAHCLPENTAIIYRHFGEKNKVETAQELRQISFARNLQLLIGQDTELAMDIGADGVHLPERDLERGSNLRKRFPDWLLTGAAHSVEAVKRCAMNGLDAAVVSPVFASDGKSAGDPIGVTAMADITDAISFPVIALGGINSENVTDLIDSGAAGLAGVSMFIGRGE